MGFSDSLIRRVALIVLLAFTGVRLADAHLHVCLDGQEAPVTVHTAEGSGHAESHHHQADHHQDRDIAPFDAALLKAGVDTDLFPIVAAFFIVPRTPRLLGYTADPLSLPPLRPPSQLRPPLRGPPL